MGSLSLASAPASLAIRLSQPRVLICSSCLLRLTHRSDASRSAAPAFSTVAPRLTFQTPEEEAPPAPKKLEWIGTTRWFYETNYPDFKPPRFAQSTVDDQHLERELVRSLAEVFLCLGRFGTLKRLDAAPVPPAVSSDINFSLKLQPGQSTPTIHFQTQNDADSILQELEMQEVPAESQGYSLGALEVDPESDQSWKLIPLADEDILLAVLKRLMRRTGRRVPDSSLQRCVDAASVYKLLTEKRRKKVKLAEVVTEEERLNLPNVKFSNYKRGKFVKDIDEGRWKVIRRELEARGLPEHKTPLFVSD